METNLASIDSRKEVLAKKRDKRTCHEKPGSEPAHNNQAALERTRHQRTVRVTGPLEQRIEPEMQTLNWARRVPVARFIEERVLHERWHKRSRNDVRREHR